MADSQNASQGSTPEPEGLVDIDEMYESIGDAEGDKMLSALDEIEEESK